MCCKTKIQRGGRANELAIAALIRWANSLTMLACLATSAGPHLSRSGLLIWRCHCRGHIPSRICDAAKVTARAAKRSVPRRLPCRIAPAIKPHKKPKRKNPRVRRLFLRATAVARNPHIAAMMASAMSREIRCVGPINPISQPPGRRLGRPLARSNHRLRRTSGAGQVRYQSEYEALAGRRHQRLPCRPNTASRLKSRVLMPSTPFGVTSFRVVSGRQMRPWSVGFPSGWFGRCDQLTMAGIVSLPRTVEVRDRRHASMSMSHFGNRSSSYFSNISSTSVG